MAADDLEPVLGTTNNTTNNRRNWFILHIPGYIVILLSSFAAVFHFPFLWLKFDNACPLYAVPVVQNVSSGVYEFVIEGVYEKTQWGSNANCNYCFCIPALSFILSFVWSWFFCLCNPGSMLESSNNQVIVLSTNQKWKIIPPATVCAMVMSILTLVCGSIMSGGMNAFCKGLTNSPVKSCQNANNVTWKTFKRLPGFYTNATWAIAETWVTFSFWLFLTIIFLVQCFKGPGERYAKNARSTLIRGRKTASI